MNREARHWPATGFNIEFAISFAVQRCDQCNRVVIAICILMTQKRFSIDSFVVSLSAVIATSEVWMTKSAIVWVTVALVTYEMRDDVLAE